MTTALATTNMSRNLLVQFTNSVIRNYQMCRRAEVWKCIDEDAPEFWRGSLLSSFENLHLAIDWLKRGWW